MLESYPTYMQLNTTNTAIHRSVANLFYQLSTLYSQLEQWPAALTAAQQAVKYENSTKHHWAVAKTAAAPIAGILANGPAENAAIVIDALTQALSLQPNDIHTLWALYYAKLTHADWKGLTEMRQQVYDGIETMIGGTDTQKLLSLRKSKNIHCNSMGSRNALVVVFSVPHDSLYLFGCAMMFVADRFVADGLSGRFTAPYFTCNSHRTRAT